MSEERRVPERFVVEPVMELPARLGWQGVHWRARCPECGWTSAPQLHPIDAGFTIHEHEHELAPAVLPA